MRDYMTQTDRYGKIWIWTAAVVVLMVPVAICVYYNAWPSMTAVLKGLLGVAPIYWTVGCIEVITFTPGLTLSHGMEPGITAVPLQDPSLIEVGFAALPGVVEGPLVSSLIERIRDYYQERQGSSVVTFVDGDDSAVLLG